MFGDFLTELLLAQRCCGCCVNKLQLVGLLPRAAGSAGSAAAQPPHEPAHRARAAQRADARRARSSPSSGSGACAGGAQIVGDWDARLGGQDGAGARLELLAREAGVALPALPPSGGGAALDCSKCAVCGAGAAAMCFACRWPHVPPRPPTPPPPPFPAPHTFASAPPPPFLNPPHRHHQRDRV